MEDTLRLQSGATGTYHDQILKELEEKKSEEALLMVQKKYELWRYQNERDEARRLQSSGNSRWVGKGMDLQLPFSSESCRSSTVDHDEEMTLESPSKRQEMQEVMKTTHRWHRFFLTSEDERGPTAEVRSPDIHEAKTWHFDRGFRVPLSSTHRATVSMSAVSASSVLGARSLRLSILNALACSWSSETIGNTVVAELLQSRAWSNATAKTAFTSRRGFGRVKHTDAVFLL